MKGTDAERRAHEVGTTEHEKKRSTRKKWLRRLRLWGPLLIIALFARGCLVEVSKTTVFGAAKARDVVEKTARELREPPLPSPPKTDKISSKTILVEVPVGESRTIRTLDHIQGAQFRVGWPDVEQGRMKVFEDGADKATCEDFPGNPITCYVDFKNFATFENIGKEVLRFYLTFTRLR